MGYQHGGDSPDGDVLPATSSGKLAFYGGTPVSQPADASQAQVTMSSTKTTTQLRADLDKVANLTNKLQAALVSLNAIKGSA